MILDKRQAIIGAIQVPEISMFPIKSDITGKWLSLRIALLKALKEKYRYCDLEIMNNCVSQTLNFLIWIGATQEPKEEVKEIELWSKWIPLSPIYEGIAIQLKSMLIKQHYPKMYAEILKGKVYSHQGLTDIKEGVIYTLEYLEKNRLLKVEQELLQRENVQKWLGIKK